MPAFDPPTRGAQPLSPSIGYTQAKTPMPAADYGTDSEFNAQFVVNTYLVKQEDAKLLT